MLRIIAIVFALSAVNAAPADAAPKGCPPGLAKKSVPCVPPGQAKKGNYAAPYARGDIIYRDYILIENSRRYNLDPNSTYYSAGGYVFRVDRDTREVLDLLGAVAAILN